MRLLSLAAIILFGVLSSHSAAAADNKTGPVAAAPAPTVPATGAAKASPGGAKPSASAAKPPVAAAKPDASIPVFPVSGAYSYSADGRRDPFMNLTGTGGDSKAPPKPTAAGIAGIRVDELSVRGIMQSRDRLVAMIQASDSRTFLIHQGDKLADGSVKSITADGLVLAQDVSDPRAKEKTREVRKALRASEDEKE